MCFGFLLFTFQDEFLFAREGKKDVRISNRIGVSWWRQVAAAVCSREARKKKIRRRASKSQSKIIFFDEEHRWRSPSLSPFVLLSSVTLVHTRRPFLSYTSTRWSSKSRTRTAELLSATHEREKQAMLVAPNGGDGIGGSGGAAGGGGNAAAPAAMTTSTQQHPNPGSLRRQSKTEIADAFVRSLRERGGLDVDAPGVAASIRSHFQLLPSRCVSFLEVHLVGRAAA